MRLPGCRWAGSLTLPRCLDTIPIRRDRYALRITQCCPATLKRLFAYEKTHTQLRFAAGGDCYCRRYLLWAAARGAAYGRRTSYVASADASRGSTADAVANRSLGARIPETHVHGSRRRNG